jgi:hypothetical protein
MEPLPADPGFGPTFTTELSWTLDDDRLVAQSCGASACRTRVLDPATARVVMIGGHDQGELIGVAGGVAVAYDAGCRGLPCAIRGIDLVNGSSSVLTTDAGLAALVGTSHGPRLIHEFREDGHLALRVVTLSGSQERTLGLPAGVRLVPNQARSGSAIANSNSRVVLAPRGRIGPDPASELQLDLDDGTTITGLGGSR